MPAALEYAPGLKKWRRREAIRRIALITAGVARVACTARYADAIGRRARLLYWQHQCLTYAPPADLVVYEEGPGAAARIASGQYVALKAPRSDRPAAGYAPQRVSRFVAEAVPTYPARSDIPVYCQERRTPDGRRWLVIVFYTPDDYYDGERLDVDTRVVAPVWPLGPDKGLGAVRDYLPTCTTPAPTPYPRTMVIYAGQPDPNDPTRFTVRYVRNGVPAVLYGRVEPIGEGGRFGNVRYAASVYARVPVND
jgi:hypothetical protein